MTMRQPQFISYSALNCFESSLSDYAMRYLVDTRTEREPQGKPASIGSALDARVKAALHYAIFGNDGDGDYSFEHLFDHQVEEHNRDFALPYSEYVFDCYQISGAYDRMLKLCQESDTSPRFEFQLTGEVGGVPTYGFPDIAVTRDTRNIIIDLKVVGSCAKANKSPTPGYVWIGHGWEEGLEESKHGQHHKDVIPMFENGLTISSAPMEDRAQKWADQLTIYSWNAGTDIGDPNLLIMIHELVFKPRPQAQPLIRVAEHVGRVRTSYQKILVKRLQRCWEFATSGGLSELTREQMDALQDRAAILDQADDYLLSVTRTPFRG